MSRERLEKLSDDDIEFLLYLHDLRSGPEFPTARRGGMFIDQRRRMLECDGQSASITRQEAKVLAVLMKSKDDMVTRDLMIEIIWKKESDHDTSDVYRRQSLRVVINRLRALLKNVKSPWEIKTVWADGWRLVRSDDESRHLGRTR